MNIDNKPNKCVTIYCKQIVINYNKCFLFNDQINQKIDQNKYKYK